MIKRKKTIGEVLVENKTITQEQLDKALERQKSQKSKLGDVLINMGFVEEMVWLNQLANHLELPFIDLKHYNVKIDIVRLLPENLARTFKAIPLDKIAGSYMVGMVDPTDLISSDTIGQKLHSDLRLALIREQDLIRTIDQVYRRTKDIAGFASEIAEEVTVYEGEGSERSSEGDNAAVAKLVDSIFEDAVQVGASDIHIEPDKDVLRIRMRVDGVLQEQEMSEKSIAGALVLRIKLISKLNISEKRLPQDGRFSLMVKDRAIDVRVSTMPIQHGESVVMRLLDQTGTVLSLDQMKMPDDILKMIKHNISRPHGMILVTGPTGSGKSTTLYACLSELNNSQNKIITVEDPVEYSLARVNQVQVNDKVGLTFARVLRAALRQDPDVVMVGEIRDGDTASIALRAALTGHLVFSTLHTNDAISAPIRLVDIGVDAFIAANALRLIIAQRLIRKLCSGCTESVPLNADDALWLKKLFGGDLPTQSFQKGMGCSQCHKSGYRGRVGVYELVEMDETLAAALRAGDTQGFYKAARSKPGYKSLAQAALGYALQGITSVEEVLELAGDLEDEERAAVSKPASVPESDPIAASETSTTAT